MLLPAEQLLAENCVSQDEFEDAEFGSCSAFVAIEDFASYPCLLSSLSSGDVGDAKAGIGVEVPRRLCILGFSLGW